MGRSALKCFTRLAEMRVRDPLGRARYSKKEPLRAIEHELGAFKRLLVALRELMVEIKFLRGDPETLTVRWGKSFKEVEDKERREERN